MALKTAKSEIVDLFIKFGADLTIVDQTNHQSALYQSIILDGAPHPISNLILNHGIRKFPDYHAYYSVLKCVIQGDVEGLRKTILKKRVSDINFYHLQGESPLSYAVVLNKVEVVKILLKKFAANVNRFHPTPLLNVAIKFQCDVEIIELLLESGAQPDVKDKFIETWSNSLNLACQYGKSVEVFKLIFTALKGEVSLSNVQTQETLLRFAMKNQQTNKIFKELIKNVKKRRVLRKITSSRWKCNLNSSNCKRLLMVIKSKKGIKLTRGVDYNGFPVVLSDHGLKYPCPVMVYLTKLRRLNGTLNSPVVRMLDHTQTLTYKYPHSYGTSEDWNLELEKLKSVIINWATNITLYDFIFIKSKEIARYAGNSILERIWKAGEELKFKRNYPYFGSFLNKKYKLALRKREAQNLAQIFLETCTGLYLHNELCDSIFELFGITFLETLEIKD